MPDPTRVLIIDDEIEVAELLGMHLERDGYRVFTANSGVEGLRQAYEHGPSALIVDLMMPGMDGTSSIVSFTFFALTVCVAPNNFAVSSLLSRMSMAMSASPCCAYRAVSSLPRK